MKTRSIPTVAAAFAALLLVSGCGETVRSGKDWQVTNAADNFQFQVTGVQNFSKRLEYVWANSGTAASVNQACSISGGSATLTILDSGGTVVYVRSLKDNGTYPTSAGTSGNWFIRVELNSADGNLNFRVQKAP